MSGGQGAEQIENRDLFHQATNSVGASEPCSTHVKLASLGIVHSVTLADLIAVVTAGVVVLLRCIAGSIMPTF